MHSIVARSFNLSKHTHGGMPKGNVPFIEKSINQRRDSIKEISLALSVVVTLYMHSLTLKNKKLVGRKTKRFKSPNKPYFYN